MDQTIRDILPRSASRHLDDVQAELTVMAFRSLNVSWVAAMAAVTLGEGVAACLGNDFTLWGVALVLALDGLYAGWVVNRFHQRPAKVLTQADIGSWQKRLGVVMVVMAVALASADIHYLIMRDLGGVLLASLVIFAACCFLRSLNGALPWIGQTSNAIMLTTMAVGFLASGLPHPLLCALCLLYGNYLLWRAEGQKFDLIVGQIRARHNERHAIEDDELTGLANQRQFKTTLDVNSRLRRSFTVLLLDLDDFSSVNAKFGAPIGDRLLKLVAARLRSVSRGSDLIARLEADEFAILAQEPANEEAAKALAGRIRAALEIPFGIDDRSIHVTASIGIWVGGEGETDALEALRQADEALLRAKAGGGSRVAFA